MGRVLSVKHGASVLIRLKPIKSYFQINNALGMLHNRLIWVGPVGTEVQFLLWFMPGINLEFHFLVRNLDVF